MRYNELTIFTDVDGTLLVPETFNIPEKNLEAIRSFIADGGRFAVATGRTPEWTYEIAEQIGVNFPCVLYNGGVIFDFEKDRPISKEYLPESAYGYVQAIAEALPWAGVVPVSHGPAFDQKDEMRMVEHILGGKPPYSSPNWRENREPWLKVLFGVPPGRTDAFLDFTRKAQMPGVRTVKTIEYLIELLPKGTSKGSALEKMYAEMGLERNKTVAVGDYFNDLEMIRTAGIGACVHGAPKELAAASKYITCPCKEGAIADLIERLKRDYP